MAWSNSSSIYCKDAVGNGLHYTAPCSVYEDLYEAVFIVLIYMKNIALRLAKWLYFII